MATAYNFSEPENMNMHSNPDQVMPPPHYTSNPPYAGQAPFVNQPGSLQQSTNTTTIVINQPTTANTASRPWTHGLCDCFGDVPICLAAFFCPHCYMCHLAGEIDNDCCSGCLMVSCNPMALVSMRSYVRGRENIKGSLLEDYLKASYCNLCFLCVTAQLGREVKFVKSQRGQF